LQIDHSLCYLGIKMWGNLVLAFDSFTIILKNSASLQLGNLKIKK